MTAPIDRTEGRIEARIEAALTQLGAEHEPPAGWEARVLAAVRTEQPRRAWWRIAVPSLTLATAAGVAAFVFWPRPLVLEVVAEQLTRVRGETPGLVRMRGEGGEERAVHDVVHIAASGGADQRAVRVYRNETDLVMRCPGNPACRISGDGIAVDVPLDKVGDYVIVAFGSKAALPAMSGTYEDDTAAARRAGASVREHMVRAR